jgi:hypothetical protein
VEALEAVDVYRHASLASAPPWFLPVVPAAPTRTGSLLERGQKALDVGGIEAALPSRRSEALKMPLVGPAANGADRDAQALRSLGDRQRQARA